MCLCNPFESQGHFWVCSHLRQRIRCRISFDKKDFFSLLRQMQGLGLEMRRNGAVGGISLEIAPGFGLVCLRHRQALTGNPPLCSHKQ